MNFTPIDINAKRCRKPVVRLPAIPPHGMFGKPEDTIQKPIKKDRNNENRVLRYEAIMVRIKREK